MRRTWRIHMRGLAVSLAVGCAINFSGLLVAQDTSSKPMNRSLGSDAFHQVDLPGVVFPQYYYREPRTAQMAAAHAH